MAQTIELYRGQITQGAAADWATLLFTNSASGAATRLIAGYVNISYPSASSTGIQYTIMVVPSGTGTSYGVPWLNVYTGGTISLQGIQFSAQAGGAWQFGNNTQSMPAVIPVYAASGTAKIIYPQVSQNSNMWISGSPDIFIGPSDSVYLTGGANLLQSITCDYAFAAVRET